MNGPFGPRANPRVIEPVLGDDALERPSHEEIAKLWRQALAQPVPDYVALSRLVVRGRS